MESSTYAYLAGCFVLLIIWSVFFLLRKDLRHEMLTVSFLFGILSVITAHYWWTVDWWRPSTISGTRVGFEDWLMGFASGGILAVAYEVFFKKRLYRMRKKCLHCPSQLTILLLLALLTAWLFWGVGLTSFWASTLALIAVAGVVFYHRKDLFINGLLSGVLMALISLFFYVSIIVLSPEWVEATYQFGTLSSILVLGIPIEEFVFWFLAGLVFGPFYEYWQGERLRKVAVRVRSK